MVVMKRVHVTDLCNIIGEKITEKSLSFGDIRLNKKKKKKQNKTMFKNINAGITSIEFVKILKIL